MGWKEDRPTNTMNLIEYIIRNPNIPIVPNNLLIGSQVAWQDENYIHVSPAMYELINDPDLDDEGLYFIAGNIEVAPPPKIFLIDQINRTINKTLQQRFKKINGAKYVRIR